MFVWFDRTVERLTLRDLTVDEKCAIVDMPISVGALDEDEDGSSVDQEELPF